ncbi:SMP-30/gluconolactonase/LRE family protein [Pelagicoccus sp. SDUM812005]|uniref:SMP-30/gluconolactonase/LRE family protein n=1 Tax=Pelagicoccus sp. SDUM812005 TaxID=3041257 RepID=UPI00280EF93E|nr:SMP-30/gluconolactonase/LRE family protein [Pelagicoccus sp. SDUM812005]MDQ8180311.1 SMP-30/gluconolactonase/LRE family protein [Pelagicoccus sp. SDUM812005]
MRGLLRPFLQGALHLVILTCIHASHANAQPQPARLFVELPEYCPTPDAFDIAPDGSLTLSCPNFADRDSPSVLMRITPDGTVSKICEIPGLSEGQKGIAMGIAYGPEGELYVCNPKGGDRGRILRMTFTRDGSLARTEVVAEGMACPNGIRYHEGAVYVTQPQLPKFGTEKNTGGLYRFLVTDRNVQVNNDASDTNLVFTAETQNPEKQFGLDGLVFTAAGSLLVGDLGDGTIYELKFEADGSLDSSSLYAQLPRDAGIDGIHIDDKGNVYAAGLRQNQILKVDTKGQVHVIAQYPDNDGSNGQIDQPSDLFVYGNKLVIANFDLMTGADMVNTKHEAPFTLSYIELED